MLESLIPVVAEWTKEALTAARRREDRAVANLVADCGFIVAAMRRLDREFHRIYSPLLYFQPQMSDARREELSAELIALAHSNEIGPRMTGLAKRIRSSPIVRDKQLPRLIDELMNVVKGALLVPPWVADGVSDVQRLGTEWRTHEGPWDDEDEPLRLSLDEILRYIRDCRDEGCARRLRADIENVMRQQVQVDVWTRVGGQTSGYVTTTSPMKYSVDAAEAVFGEILGTARSIFPELPSPDWVWE